MTPEEIAEHCMGVVTMNIWSVTTVQDALIDDIKRAIAAAVAAEREAIIDIICAADPEGCHNIVTAIRARSGTEPKGDQ